MKIYLWCLLAAGLGLASCGQSGKSLEEAAVESYLEEFNGEQEPPEGVYDRDATIKFYKQKAKDYHANHGEYESYEVTKCDTLDEGSTIEMRITFIHSKTRNPKTFTFKKGEDNEWNLDK